MTKKEPRRDRAAEKKARDDKRACSAPGCRCEAVPRDNPACTAHDVEPPCDWEVVIDEPEVEPVPGEPVCLDCGGPEGGGNCTRCSFKEPTRPHLLVGGTMCQVCGAVEPLSFSECPGPPADETSADRWDRAADATPPGMPVVPPSGVCVECGAATLEGNMCEPCAELEAATAPAPKSTGETRRSESKKEK